MIVPVFTCVILITSSILTANGFNPPNLSAAHPSFSPKLNLLRNGKRSSWPLPSTAEVTTDQPNENDPIKTKLQELSERSGNYKLNCIDTNLDKKCYFYQDNGINFRHEGEYMKTPSKFFLLPRTSSKVSSKVLVLFSASGSGKTVELAGSSASRNADLTLLISADDKNENRVQDVDDRNEASMDILKRRIISNSSLRWKDLNELVALATKERPLNLVVAIDEASQCPMLVRSIISDQKSAEEAVADALGEENIKVKFSVGGTGIAAAACGSNVENFAVISPSAEKLSKSKEIWDYMTEDISVKFQENISEKPTYAIMEKYLPIFSTMLTNGRMASIIAKRLRNKQQEEITRNGTIDEGKLMNTCIGDFMESNGMNKIYGDPIEERMVAAHALAVLLFQWGQLDNNGIETSEDKEEFANFMGKKPSGVTANKGIRKVLSTDNVMRRLVTEFGLLEPSKTFAKLVPGSKAELLWDMKPAQQLIALFLLGMDMEIMVSPRTMPSSLRFEFMCTHIVKAAIAAASTIDPEEGYQPNIYQVLTSVGFEVDKLGSSKDLKKDFEACKEYTVVPQPFQDDDAQRTFQLSKRVHFHKKTEMMDPMDEDLKKFLENTLEDADLEQKCFVPISCINCKNGNVADGFVVDCAKKKEETAEEDPTKMAILIECKDKEDSTQDKMKFGDIRKKSTILQTVSFWRYSIVHPRQC